MKMKFIIAMFVTWLMLLTTTLYAQAGSPDSGVYFDPARSGEGISLSRDGDTILFFMFTYGEEICGPIEPEPSPPSKEPDDGCNINGQRWLFGFGDISSNVVSGELFLTDGVDYPFADRGFVGDESPVGDFLLVKDEVGWVLVVSHVPGDLSPDDPLFTLFYDLSGRLFIARD